MPRLCLLGAVLLAASLFVTGCSDDDDDEKAMGGGNPPVLVLNEEDRTPVSGVKVVVMDPATNTPLADPVVTDDEGYARFTGLPTGHFPVLAFGCFRWSFLGFAPDLLPVVQPSGGKSGGLLAPPAATAPSHGPLQYFARPAGEDSLPRFRGVVRDAVTKEPLAQAFLGLSGIPTGYEGATRHSDDVTGPDGTFSVSGLPIAINPITGNLLQIDPLKVVRHGYRPFEYIHDFPNGSNETDVQGIVIDLAPVGATDTGVVFGQVIEANSREPVVGLPVALGLARTGEKAGPGLTGWSAVTDTTGRYRITGLPAGIYNILPGYLVGDRFVYRGRVPQVEITRGDEIAAGVQEVVPEIETIIPRQGAVLAGKPGYFEWSPVKGATAYSITLDYGTTLDSEQSIYQVPPEVEIGPGLHVWEVMALDPGGRLLGMCEVRSLFRIAEPGE